CLQYKNYPFTF
nr:immunoglobulin light chain junction region [Macaca mulatta]MOV79750.1 immunoglobulin light chain junction region [Macaca mulatta]